MAIISQKNSVLRWCHRMLPATTAESSRRAGGGAGRCARYGRDQPVDSTSAAPKRDCSPERLVRRSQALRQHAHHLECEVGRLADQEQKLALADGDDLDIGDRDRSRAARLV